MPYIIEGGYCQLCKEFAKNLSKICIEFDFLSKAAFTVAFIHSQEAELKAAFVLFEAADSNVFSAVICNQKIVGIHPGII